MFAVAVYVAFGGALHNEFVNWDDNRFIYENRFVQSLSAENLAWMFTTSNLSYWHPLTMLSHAIDISLWGLNPHGHHVGNLLLHAINMTLVYALYLALTRAASTRGMVVGLAMTLVWGLHPLRVESVAWATERSDVLCATFMLATLVIYLRYVASPSRRRYAAMLACFALALMAKPLAVTIPVVLLLLDYFPLGRLTQKNARALVVEKLPLFALSLLDATLTVQAQDQVGSLANGKVPLWERLMNAAHSLVVYLTRTVWPVELSPYYPLPTDYLTLTHVLSAAAVLAITAWCIMRRSRARALATTWALYLVVAAPVIGIMQAGGQASADRFTYLPTLPFYFLVGGAVAAWLESRGSVPAWLPIFAAFAIVFSCGLSRAQVGVWRDSQTLWETVATLQPEVPIAHNNLGAWYHAHGDLARAEREYKKTIAIFPAHANAHSNLGYIYQGENKLDEAAAEFNTALEINPNHGIALANLAVNDFMRGRVQDAIVHAARAQALGAQVSPQLLQALAPYQNAR